MAKKIGERTYIFDFPARIVAESSVVGKKEHEGPFGKYFTVGLKDDMLGQKTYEKAERKMFEKAIKLALSSADIKASKVDFMVGGDLLNQIVSSNYAAEHFQIPFVGVYAACSTMSESLAVASCFLDAGIGSNILCCTGSHFSTAERQFRGPLELASQRQTYSQWTVTAVGCSVLSKNGKGPKITHVTFGKVVDWGVKDLGNMGAAMAPAAADTLTTFFHDTKSNPDDYDMIVTGDLGKLGSDILKDLMYDQGYDLKKNYTDCGHVIFDATQKAFQGGSGAGCSASIFNSYLLSKLKNKEFKKIVFLPTGALMSITTNQQGDSIPGVSHLVVVEADDE